MKPDAGIGPKHLTATEQVLGVTRGSSYLRNRSYADGEAPGRPTKVRISSLQLGDIRKRFVYQPLGAIHRKMNTIFFGLMTLACLFNSISFAQPKELILYKSEDKLKEKLVLELDKEKNNFRMYSNTKSEINWTINRFSGNWIQKQDTLVLTITDVIAHRRNERRIIDQLDQN